MVKDLGKIQEKERKKKDLQEMKVKSCSSYQKQHEMRHGSKAHKVLKRNNQVSHPLPSDRPRKYKAGLFPTENTQRSQLHTHRG